MNRSCETCIRGPEPQVNVSAPCNSSGVKIEANNWELMIERNVDSGVER